MSPLTTANVSNITGILDLFVTAHEVSYGVLGNGFLFVMWLLLGIGMWKVSGEQRNALMISSLLTFFVAVIMLQIGIVNAFFAAAPLIVFAAAVFT